MCDRELLNKIVEYYNGQTFEDTIENIVVHPAQHSEIPERSIVLVNGPHIRWNNFKYSKSYFGKVCGRIEKCASEYNGCGIVLVTTQLDPEHIIYPSNGFIYRALFDEFLERFKENFAGKVRLHGQIYYKDRAFDRNEIGCVNVVGGMLVEKGIDFELGDVLGPLGRTYKF